MVRRQSPRGPMSSRKIKLDRSTGQLVRRLVRDYVRPYLHILLLSVACMGIVSGATAYLAYYFKPLINNMVSTRDTGLLYTAVWTILAIFLARGFATFGQQVAINWAGQRIIADVRQQLYRHVIHADLAFFHNNPTGALISRFTNDVARLRYAVSDALTAFGLHFLTVASLVVVMFIQDWRLACITLFVFPAAVFPIVRIGKRMRKVSRNTQIEQGRLTMLLDEAFRGARHVKAYGMEPYEIARAGNVIERLFRLSYKSFRTRSASYPIMDLLGGLAMAAVLLYGGYQVIGNARDPGAFVSFLAAVMLAYQPMKQIALVNASLQEGLAAADRIFTALDLPPQITDKPGAAALQIKDGRIDLKDVRFAYVQGVPALDGVTLTVPAGKTVALVGPSGAGKSTILNLIPRFHDVDAGQVLIDGVDIRDVTLDSLRANIGLVSQEISLFDDSVRANIAYGRADASFDDIVAAAKRAAAHDFIMELPDGYDTQVGGQGAKLSGGQRQRVAIARAMLKNAPILLLDEATSALDTESERHVQAALKELMAGRTTLVIAHRLSTVLDADVICVIEAGRLVEQGRHAELVARGGVYAKLYKSQIADADMPDQPPAGAAPKPARRKVARPV
jgi:subfamily B ATP-binding cassette protein MsbA